MEYVEGEIAQAIQKFLEENPGLHLHPGRTPEEWALLVIKNEGCPCVPGRNKCPCDEALDDIERLNHCRCYLFCNDAYIKIYDQVIATRRKKTKVPGGGRQGTGAGSPQAAGGDPRGARAKAP